MDNKLLVRLSPIGYQQAAATERTNETIHPLLNYSAPYPVNGILYRSSDMVLCAHSNAVFHNKIKGRSRSDAYVFLSENDPMPRWNGPVINIAQIIIFVISSDSEEELRAIFITSQDMAEMRNTLEEMRRPQTKSPIQNDN